MMKNIVRDDVTSDGRLFHVLAATIGDARSPMLLACRIVESASVGVDDERIIYSTQFTIHDGSRKKRKTVSQSNNQNKMTH